MAANRFIDRSQIKPSWRGLRSGGSSGLLLWRGERNHLPILARRYPPRSPFPEAIGYKEFNDLRHKSPHTYKNRAEVKKLSCLTNLYKYHQGIRLKGNNACNVLFAENDHRENRCYISIAVLTLFPAEDPSLFPGTHFGDEKGSHE
jgi:hypothetical protein